MKIIISAGGTGGHIYPALSIIKKFAQLDNNFDCLYIGTHNRMEKEIIPKEGIKYEELEIYGFSKTNVFRDIKNVFLIRKANKKCLNIMQKFKPDVVIGVGGYVTYPVIKAAKKLGIKTFIHEQNSVPGKSNVWLSKIVDLVGISFKNSESYFPLAKKIVYTGNPCGDRALSVKKISKESLGFKKNKRLIVIVAGSLGSVTLNEKFKAFLKIIGEEDYQVLYITGKNYYDDFVKNDKFPSNVRIIPYLDNLAGLFQDTDLIISRAGASTISEILALKKPSILIPSPYVANNHQYYNALDLVNMQVAEMIEEKNLNAGMLQITINELLNHENKLKEMQNNLDKISNKSAATIIYEEVRKLIS